MVYVDKMKQKFRGMIMCHMLADTVSELNTMADKIGIKQKWFQNTKYPHYDICQTKKQLAIQNGAIEVNNHKLVEILNQIKKPGTNAG